MKWILFLFWRKWMNDTYKVDFRLTMNDMDETSMYRVFGPAMWLIAILGIAIGFALALLF